MAACQGWLKTMMPFRCRVYYLGILSIYLASEAKGSGTVNNSPSSGQLVLMAETLKLFGLNPYCQSPVVWEGTGVTFRSPHPVLKPLEVGLIEQRRP